LFSVEMTTAIFPFGADCAEEVCVKSNTVVVAKTANASLNQLVFMIFFSFVGL